MAKRPPKKPVGRPTKYKTEYANQAEKLCLLGATDKKLIDFFGVTESTFYLWKQIHKDFSESIKNAKDERDELVERSLLERASGYSHPDTHISVASGEVIKTSIIKHYPPDPTSMIFWLKNRQPEKWRDRRELEHSGEVVNKHELSEELQNLLDETYTET